MNNRIFVGHEDVFSNALNAEFSPNRELNNLINIKGEFSAEYEALGILHWDFS
jgi:hypothetical protein